MIAVAVAVGVAGCDEKGGELIGVDPDGQRAGPVLSGRLPIGLGARSGIPCHHADRSGWLSGRCTRDRGEIPRLAEGWCLCVAADSRSGHARPSADRVVPQGGTPSLPSAPAPG